jgi:hypothetical protein
VPLQCACLSSVQLYSCWLHSMACPVGPWCAGLEGAHCQSAYGSCMHIVCVVPGCGHSVGCWAVAQVAHRWACMAECRGGRALLGLATSAIACCVSYVVSAACCGSEAMDLVCMFIIMSACDTRGRHWQDTICVWWLVFSLMRCGCLS